MNLAKEWFKKNKWEAHVFQKQTWKAIANGQSGLLNAPTGFGKTFALWFGIIQNYFDNKKSKQNKLHCLWITPLRALSKEIYIATNKVSEGLDLNYKIELRSGDSTAKDRTRQKKNNHQALITTPESLHIMLASKDYAAVLSGLEFVVIDEWHELLGSKRGVQMELALSRLKSICPKLKIWGISATIGNLDEAKEILLGHENKEAVIIKSNLEKRIKVHTVFPDEIEKYPWGGHLGIQLLPKIIPIIEENNSTLIFTNTRAQAEIWYQRLLDYAPELAGSIAMHHGSLDIATRKWVEEHLHQGQLKAVVCTSSLDLGVDFQPVDTIIQIGSAKGIARFMQRAGRSGHSPNAISHIYFVPTHSLEIIEGHALKSALKNGLMESRLPYVRSFDVLIQYLVTLAVSDGFRAEQIYNEVKSTHCFESMSESEWQWCLDFITKGGSSLNAYNEFHKVIIEAGVFKVTSRQVAMRHRLSIGTIVSSPMMQVKFMKGKRLGVIEEWFISKFKTGDVFWFAGKNLEFSHIHQMDVFVKLSKAKKGIIPSFMGGRMALSSQLSLSIREALEAFLNRDKLSEELKVLEPLLYLQKEVSQVPSTHELLIEQFESKEGHHLFIYPFDGRLVHEGMAALLSYRISILQPISFSISVNDYGFELLSDQLLEAKVLIDNNLFSSEYLFEDAMASFNSSQMAQRQFRDIASIAGLVFNGFPGKQKKNKHLQASSQLFFNVFEEYEANNLLLLQAHEEVLQFQLEIVRQQAAFKRINESKIIVKKLEQPSPFCFPLMVERFREVYSNESIEMKVEKYLKGMVE
jgi:ATP-dependent helicase Lhr and Lhr-like helicase